MISIPNRLGLNQIAKRNQLAFRVKIDGVWEIIDGE